MNFDLDVPDGWEMKKLEEISKIKGGKRLPKGEKLVEYKTNFPYIRVSDFKKGSVKKESILYLKPEVHNKIKRYKISSDDVYISIAGTIGLVGIIPKELNNANLTENAAKITNLKNIDKKFLHHFLESSLAQSQIERLKGTTSQPKLALERVGKIKILIPTINEQQKIADILSKVNEQIDLTENIISRTEELKKGLMQKLLTKGVFHNNLNERKIGLKNYKLPEKWELKTIGDTSFLKGRIGWQGLTTKEYLSKGNYLLVTGTDFNDGDINWDTCVYVEGDRYNMDENIQLKNEDILVTKDGTIGKIAYVSSLPKPATLNSGIFVLRPLNGEYYPKFLYYILNSFYFDYFMNILKAGSTISHLYQRDFVKFKFPVPPLDEQKQIASILSKVDEQIQDNKKELKHLHELKKGLMQDLLTGKVRVSV